jgi:transcriptional regulator GlxA family with amidase domain
MVCYEETRPKKSVTHDTKQANNVMQNKIIRPFNIAILALNDSVATTITGPMDVFSMTGVLYEQFQNKPPVQYFNVQIVTTDGNPVRCINNIVITPHCSIKECNEPDMIIIPGILNIDTTLNNNDPVIDWLRQLHAKGCKITAICSGSLLLSATGLLDGKTATTHWAMENEFRKRFPLVKLNPEELITDEDGLVCSGGYDSFLDVSIYMIDKFCGSTVALKCSKIFLRNPNRRSQAPYAVFHGPRDHGDKQIIQIQELLEKNLAETFDFTELAKEYGMSRRTLERHFRKATGMTPLAYLQRVRVESAKELLETGSSSFDEICYQVGYMDNSFFRKLFIKCTSLRPREYRTMFAIH